MLKQDLGYTGLTDGQYWRSVILALLVIALVIAGIASAIFSYGFVDELLYWSGKRLCLDDILNTTNIFPERLPSMWVSTSGFAYQNNDGDLSLFNTTSGNVTVLISNYTLVRTDGLNINTIEPSNRNTDNFSESNKRQRV